jgi:hypothetical protein
MRWLSGEYTNRHRDWQSTFQRITTRPHRPSPAELPPADPQRVFRLLTQGAPLAGRFISTMPQVLARNRYDNHPAVERHADKVEAKFAKEEAKSFHIHLPRIFIFFIAGLLLSPLQWAVRKGKGRICVDCTNARDPAGSPNSYIPSPSAENADECPPVHYGTAFIRFCVRLWRMRITRPTEDILQHCDDVDSAFRRIIYHPDVAAVFAYVFRKYLMIPVGQVFGSRSAPSYFSLSSDLRAFVATTHDLVDPTSSLEPLAANASIPPLPSDWSPDLYLAPAIADALNLPITLDDQGNFLNATFVDDNGVAAYRPDMRTALHQSVRAAYEIYGFPADDRRLSCLNDEKWDPVVNYLMLYLGFIIDSRAMTVTWPREKRIELANLILVILDSSRHESTPKEIASILGKLRSALTVAPWGFYMSYSIQQALTRALRNSRQRPAWFWQTGKIRLPKAVVKDLRVIVEYLLQESYDHLWTRLIGLMIPRIAYHRLLSDASYGGIGGWSPTFLFQWRVTRDDLARLGFPMRLVSRSNEPIDTDANPGLHINPLEFLAAIINIWLGIILLRREPISRTGHIVDLVSDNTTALSWMQLATHTPDPLIRHLARFTSALLVRGASHHIRFQPQHLAGVLNVEADYLSRLKQGSPPSWESVMSECSQLRTCRICLLPSELLSRLAELLSSTPIEVTYDELTTQLLALEPIFLPVGSIPVDLTSSLHPTFAHPLS